MNLDRLTHENLIEIKKALNELYANRIIFTPPNEVLKKKNDKYMQMDLDLIQKIVHVLENQEQC